MGLSRLLSYSKYALARYSLTTVVAAGLLANCGGGLRSSGFAPATSVRMTDPDTRRNSQVFPDTKTARALLFTSDYGIDGHVYIYTWPGMKHEGTLTGFHEPVGECTDTKGNVYIANTGLPSNVVEYSRTGNY